MKTIKHRMNPFERAERRNKISRLYLTGKSLREIGKEIGYSFQQVHADLKAIHEEWRKENQYTITEIKNRDLEKLDVIERQCWEEWEKSKNVIKKNSVRTGSKGDETITSVEERLGDPRYLEGVLKCIERRCKILGIEKGVNVEGGFLVNSPFIESQDIKIQIVPCNKTIATSEEEVKERDGLG